MSTLQEAKQAFLNFNHSHYKGKTLTIRWATPKVKQQNQRCASLVGSTSGNPHLAECRTHRLPTLEDTADESHSQPFLSQSPLQDHHSIPDCLLPEPGSKRHSGKSPLAKLKACLEELPLSLDIPCGSPVELRESPTPTTFSEGVLQAPADPELELESPFFADHSNSSDTSSLFEDDPVITKEGGSIVLQQCCISEVCATRACH